MVKMMIFVKIEIGFTAEHVDYIAAHTDQQIRNYQIHIHRVHQRTTKIIEITPGEFYGAGPDNMNRRSIVFEETDFPFWSLKHWPGTPVPA